MPKDNEVDEKVMPDSAAQQVAAYRWRPIGWGVIGDWLVGPPEIGRIMIGDDRYEVEELVPAATVAELRAEVERLRAALHIETHKVITCGVAAVHPDASLSRRMEYAGKWNSPQAQHVRVLRDRADAAERRVGELENPGQQDDYLDALDALWRIQGNDGPIYKMFLAFVNRVIPLTGADPT